MTENFIKIKFLIRKLRYKYRSDPDRKNTDILNFLAGHLNFAYPNEEKDNIEFRKAFEARKQRKKRTNAYFRLMFECYDDLFFVTLEFNDHTLSLGDRTRKEYVKRWLEENCRDYYANIDYGKKKGREHYHALVALKSIHYSAWNYGFSNVKTVYRGKGEDLHLYRMSTYLNKLNNHANKLTSGKAFHKRGFKQIDELPF